MSFNKKIHDMRSLHAFYVRLGKWQTFKTAKNQRQVGGGSQANQDIVRFSQDIDNFYSIPSLGCGRVMIVHPEHVTRACH